MKLVYFGTGSFAVPALERMAQHVALVVTQPDRPSGRGLRLQPSAVKVKAGELGLDVFTPEKARSIEFVEQIEKLRPDALLVASYGQILSERLLNSAIRGGINLHGSILPRWRGAAPIQRAIQHRDPETGVTLMQMDRGMDTGDVIDIQTTAIREHETYGDLQDRLAEIAADLAESWIPRIISGAYPRERQDDSQATIAPKVERGETEIAFTERAIDAEARIRAFTPAPGCYFMTDLGQIRVHKAELGTGSGEPGVVLCVKGGLEVAMDEGSLILSEVQPQGKKKMSGHDFANGMRLRIGMKIQ
ncbi:MAG TPA: methionyl-tRNA formyltransferase [Fimbriimonadaceae bacterium]|nr:methionyl-tRNA formyltransferase [Fimbriimonadaceae bacterium]